LRASLFWLGRSPLAPDRSYLLKTGAAKVPMQLETVHRVIDASSLDPRAGATAVERHDVAECTLRLARPVAVDPADFMTGTGRFVIVDGFEIRGGGIVHEVLPDEQARARERVALRNYKWETSFIAPERRAERFGQRATLVLITGPSRADRKGVGKALEAALFGEGRNAYFLGMGSVVYGVDADLDRDPAVRHEHVRRLAEVAHILLDSGTLLIASAADLTAEEIDLITTSVGGERTVTVWLGPDRPADVGSAVDLAEADAPALAAGLLYDQLARMGVLAPPAGGVTP
jgi:bifunctional enzyme CysN/CysC